MALSELLTDLNQDTPAIRLRRRAAQGRIRRATGYSDEAIEAALLVTRLDPELVYQTALETQELLKQHGGLVQIEMAALVESPEREEQPNDQH